VGVAEFAEALRQQSVPVVEVDWRPPAGGDLGLVEILKRIYSNQDLMERINAANTQVLDRILNATPGGRYCSSERALGLAPRTILHAGPPISWERMCGPQKRAVLGAIRFEGWAETERAAAALIESGQVNLSPCHRYGAVGR